MRAGDTFTIFDQVTRRPVGRVTCDPDQLAAHLKNGQKAVPGRLDWAMRLDDDGNAVLDPQRQREIAGERRRQASLSRIEELERKMLRRVRELLAERDPQMKEIDDEVASLRADLSGETETSEPGSQSR